MKSEKIATIVPDDSAREILYDLYGGGGGSSELIVKCLDGNLETLTEEDFGDAEYIRDYCFSYLPLRSAYIPNTITEIGEGVFCNCYDLTEVHLPDNLTIIQSDMFSGCTSITSTSQVNIPDSVTFIGAYAFSYCENLTDMTLPDSVTSIGQGAFAGTKISSLNIPPHVTVIQPETFCNCNQLTSINIPEGILAINSQSGSGFAGAFSQCGSVIEITIPATVQTIGKGTFYECNSLESITTPLYNSTIGNLFNGSNHIPQSLKTINIANNTISISTKAFEGCGGVTQITLPSSLTTISSEAFYDYSGDIEIPVNTSSIGTKAFYTVNSITVAAGNEKYKAVNNCVIDKSTNTLVAGCNNSVIPIDQDIVKIEASAFEMCNLIQTISLPATVTEIGSRAFASCSNLATVSLNSGLKTIAANAFGTSYSDTCPSITSLIIPDSVTSIAKGALTGCVSLQSLTTPSFGGSSGSLPYLFGSSTGASSPNVPNSLTTVTVSSVCTEIPASAFYKCSKITTINLPNTITSIGNAAFSGCTLLSSVDIPSTITSLGQSAFAGTAITTLVIPSGITKIPTALCNGCKSLTSITLHNNITEIQNQAFYDCSSLTALVIPSSVTKMNEILKGCTKLASLTTPFTGVDEAGSSSHGYLAYLFGVYNYSQVKTTDVPASLKTVVISEGTEMLSDYAFGKCANIQNITLPDTLTFVGRDVFAGCASLQYNTYDNGSYIGSSNNPYMLLVKATSTSVTSIQINANAKFICSYAFENCAGLTGSITVPQNIIQLCDFVFSRSSFTDVTLPEGITEIPLQCFAFCSSLVSVSIPSTITKICDSAFYNCSNLITINYSGTIDQWNQITKESNWDYGTGNYTIYCTDGNIPKSN